MHIRYSFCFVVILLIAGCSKSGTEVAPVSGRVTVDGKPVEYLVVTFQSEGKSSGIGNTFKDGHYELIYKRGVMGAAVGPNRVTIALDTELAHRPNMVPARYNTQTELKREVKAGESNVFDFDLKTDAKESAEK
jgi:hypothetical protein